MLLFSCLSFFLLFSFNQLFLSLSLFLCLFSAPDPGISARPHADNPRYFDVVIAGPASSPYEGGLFKLELFLTEQYPMEPPKVRFLTRLYHPNVDKIGRICLDILKGKSCIL